MRMKRMARVTALFAVARPLKLTAILRQAIAMQVAAVHVEPDLGALMVGAEAPHQPPEPRRVVHLDEMRDLVGGEICEHEARGENEPPGIGQDPGGGAGTPAACLIAHRNPPDRDAKLGGVVAAGSFELTLGLAAQKIADPTIDMWRVAGDAKQPLSIIAGFGPHRAADIATMRDPVWRAAKRNNDAVG